MNSSTPYEPLHLEEVLKPAFWVRLILIAGFLVVLAANLPGQMNWDSVYTYYQVRNSIPTVDPPMVNLIVDLLDRIVPGPGLLVTFTAALFFVSLISLPGLSRRVSWWAAAAALFIVFVPNVLVGQGTVWRDTLFADLAVAGFVCLAWAARYWDVPGPRLIALAGTIVFLCAAALSRENGLICLVVACAAVFFIGRKAGRFEAGRTAIRVAAASAVVFGSFVVLSIVHAKAQSEAFLIPYMQTFDIAGVTSINPNIDLSRLDHGDAAADRMIKSQAVAKFTPRNADLLAQDAPELRHYLDAASPADVSSEWWYIVTNHPIDYLHQRWNVFRGNLVDSGSWECVPVFVGTRGDPKMVAKIGLSYGVRQQDQQLYDYGSRFFHTPVLSHLFYALLSIMLIVVLRRRGRPEDLAIASMLTAALLFSASFFLIVISCAYRLMYFMDMAALTGLLYFAIDPSLDKYRSEPAAS